MFTRIKGFLNRHRHKFIVGTIFVGSVICITRYTQRKLREWQQKEIQDMLEKIKRQQYFACTERTCNEMILSLAASLRESIIKAVDTEAIVNRLRSGCADKLESWNELKVLAIARSSVIIYSYAMLATFIRIQFNVMGGHVYKDIKKSDSNTIENCNKQYMSLSSHFIYNGVNKLCQLMIEKVIEITTPISLKDELNLRDLEQIYWSITSSIYADSANDPIKNLPEYMLPQNNEQETDPMISKMICETLDLLESTEAQNITQANVRSGFVLLVDHISEYFTGPSVVKNGTQQNGISTPAGSGQSNAIWSGSDEANTNSFTDINRVSIPMAKIIPIVNGQVPDKPTSKDLPTDWLQRLILNNELKTLGANIYEAFSF